MRPLIAALLCIACAHGAQAAPFADPTRPPATRDAERPERGTPDAPRLESVLIAPDRRIAVINGQQVVVGARIAGGEVVQISEGEVVIRNGGRLDRLRLVPELRQAPAARERGGTQ